MSSIHIKYIIKKELKKTLNVIKFKSKINSITNSSD